MVCGDLLTENKNLIRENRELKKESLVLLTELKETKLCLKFMEEEGKNREISFAALRNKCKISGIDVLVADGLGEFVDSAEHELMSDVGQLPCNLDVDIMQLDDRDKQSKATEYSTSRVGTGPCDKVNNSVEIVSVIESIQLQICVLKNKMSDLLFKLKQPLVVKQHIPVNKNVSMGPVINSRVQQSKISRKKVLILADSHGRGCARILSQFLNESYDISSFVKPGAGISEIVKMVNKQTRRRGSTGSRSFAYIGVITS